MTLVTALYFLNVLVPLWLARRSCVRSGMVEVNPILTFTFGFIAYWILPMGLGLFRVGADEPAFRLWFLLFDGIPAETLTLYFLVTLGCYLCFWGGSEWMRRRFPDPPRRHPHYRRLFFYRNTLNLPLAVGTILAAGYAFLVRDRLFRGYTGSLITPAPPPNVSAFNAVSVSLFSVALTYAAKLDERMGDGIRFRVLLQNHFFVICLLVSILVLSLGGRLYLISSLVMLLAYRTTYFRRLPVGRLLLFGLAGAALAGFYSLVRQGQSLGASQGLISLVLEPVFVSLSLLHFLQFNGFELLKFPIFLLGDFVNLVPTSLLPGKAAYLLDPTQYGYQIFSPAGGLSSFFSFMVNFGVLGTFLALFAMGCGLSYLRGRDRTLLHRVIYVMLTGWIGFTFFRDGFSLSIVKSMFEFSIAQPILIVLALQVLSTIVAAARMPAAAQPADSLPPGRPG